MPNSSATGGYLVPGSTRGFPSSLTMLQFIQTVLVGTTAITPASLVRPAYQENPPASPDRSVSWIAFDVNQSIPDANAYIGLTNDEETLYSRNEALEVLCTFYGPAAMDNAALVRDGLQLSQNREALRAANMAFVDVGPIQQGSDLVNGKFLRVYRMTVNLRRQIQREYPILPIASVDGSIYYVNNVTLNELPFQTEDPDA